MTDMYLPIADAIENTAALPAPFDNAGLTRPEPAYASVVRVMLTLNCVPLVVGAAVLDVLVLRKFTLGVPLLSLAMLAISLWIIAAMPKRRYDALGYDLGPDPAHPTQLRIARGVLWHSDTIVPFVRVQHIDVSRGPIERSFGTATLTVHTAGNHNSTVSLPGLSPATAEAMRDTVRAHIQSDFA